MKKIFVLFCMIAIGFMIALAAFDNTSAQSAESEGVKPELKQIKAALAKTESERDNLKAKVAVEQRSRDQLQVKINELSLTREQLQKLVEKFTFTCDQSRQQLEEIINTRDKLKKQVTELSSSRDKLQLQYNKLAASHNQLSKQVERLTELRDQAVAQAQTTQKRIEILVTMLNAKKQETREQQDTITITNQAQDNKQTPMIENSILPTTAVQNSQPAANPNQIGERPICHSFNLTRPLIKPGQTSMLSWQVSNADRIRIEPDIGTVSALGSRVIDPSKTTTYTLIAANGAGESRQTCKVEVGKNLTISSERIPSRIPLKPNPVSDENKILSQQQSSVSDPNTTLGKFLGYRARKDKSGKFIFIPIFDNQQEE